MRRGGGKGWFPIVLAVGLGAGVGLPVGGETPGAPGEDGERSAQQPEGEPGTNPLIVRGTGRRQCWKTVTRPFASSSPTSAMRP